MLYKKLALPLVLTLLALCLGGCPAVPFIVNDERDLSTQTADTSIESKIKAGLVQENPSQALSVNVYSFSGHVFLVGDPDKPFRTFAEKTATSVAGVKRVTTHWFPVGTSDRVTDSRIETGIDTNLLFAKGVASTQINVDVWGGNVVLLGLVGKEADIERAQRAVRGVAGVKSVTSYLMVYAPPANK